ncbi:hypothetical protein GCM10010271_65880 [Streptomyces kurssanovii]|nr:hypothetical protein GCM10010271_65880 [Streptomyces kurssanovii]
MAEQGGGPDVQGLLYLLDGRVHGRRADTTAPADEHEYGERRPRCALRAPVRCHPAMVRNGTARPAPSTTRIRAPPVPAPALRAQLPGAPPPDPRASIAGEADKVSPLGTPHSDPGAAEVARHLEPGRHPAPQTPAGLKLPRILSPAGTPHLRRRRGRSCQAS